MSPGSTGPWSRSGSSRSTRSGTPTAGGTRSRTCRRWGRGDEVLRAALTRLYAPHVTPSRYMVTKRGELRGIGSVVKTHDGREYVVWKDGSWRRKDKLESRRDG